MPFSLGPKAVGKGIVLKDQDICGVWWELGVPARFTRLIDDIRLKGAESLLWNLHILKRRVSLRYIV